MASRSDEFNAAAAAKSDAMRDIEAEFGPSGRVHNASVGGVKGSSDRIRIPEHHTSEAFIPSCSDCKSDVKSGEHPRKGK